MSFLNKAMLLVFLSLNLHAVESVIQATLKPDRLGKQYCQAGFMVAVDVPTMKDKTGEYEYKHQAVDEKGLASKHICPATITESDKKTKPLAKTNPQIEGKDLFDTDACSNEGSSGVRDFCIYKDNKLFAHARYNFDTRTASISDIINISAANRVIGFTIQTTGGMGGSFEVCYGDKNLGDISANADCSSPFTKVSFNQNNIKLSDLDPNLTYAFKVRMIEDGTPQAWTGVYERTPSIVNFPINSYNGEGGELGFSCRSSNEASTLMLIITLGLLMFWRYKKKASMLLMVFFLVMPKESHAELGQMNFGILGAMYRPDLDSEQLSSGETVFPFYRCHFRKKVSDTEGPINPLMGFEADWHLWDAFGSLQLGFGASYTYVKGHGLRLKNGQPDCDDFYEEASTALHMYQIRPQLTYIFDPFVEYVPLAPYLRAAVIGQGYNFTNDGKDAGNNSFKPNGFRFGYQFALGLMFMLDFLEPSSVTNARSAELFEHVFLKGELSYTKIDTFGKPGLNFSAKDVMGTDWPLMWTFGLVFELPN